MRRLFLTMLTFAVAAGVNTLSVDVQQRHQLLTRIFKRWDWYAHLALILPGWMWFFFFLLHDVGKRARWPLDARLRPAGLFLSGAGTLLSLVSIVQLGPERTLDGYFFGRPDREEVSGGLFHWLRNPMYDGYVLTFVGTALRKANAAYLLLAMESFLLLNVLEARVENRPFGGRRAESHLTTGVEGAIIWS